MCKKYAFFSLKSLKFFIKNGIILYKYKLFLRHILQGCINRDKHTVLRQISETWWRGIFEHMTGKKWIKKNDKVTPDMIMDASSKSGVPPIVATVLLNRGIAVSDFRQFLTKSKQGILSPMSMLDMDKAVERICRAIRSGESIVVYGDYDVDGITSTALLYDTIKSLGGNVDYYIPDRKDEGYGINIMAVNKLIKSGVKLLITVDCGITAVGEVEFAKLQGMDVIITDHHTCKERIPEAAVAVINPKRPDDEYEFDGLAGVGVAFKVSMGVAMGMGKSAGEFFEKYVDLAAVGTIADVVPLINENRVIVDRGLQLLQEPQRAGLRALLEIAGMSDKKVTCATIAFGLAPRLNAAGRMGSATTAVELLLTTDSARAREIAEELDAVNKTRQETEYEIHRDAMEMIEADKDFSKKKVVVLAKEGWHNGVIGIVASRITEMYHRPCILISLTDGVGKGSGRSVQGFNLFEALGDSKELLTNYGGHAIASGLGIEEGNIEAFTKRINEYAETNITEDAMVPQVKIDATIKGETLTMATAKTLAVLEPFGMGNETPVFAVMGAEVVSVSGVGADKKHIRMMVAKDGMRVNCIGFGLGEYVKNITPAMRVDIAFKIDINSYMGKESLQLVLTDIKTSD